MYVAFVAPWCGHCQRMAPEYSKAAKGLAPLIPLYAVDCDAEKNKPLCASQGVKGFPTVKLFPRGGLLPPIDYPGERTSKAFFYFADHKVPDVVVPLKGAASLPGWLKKVRAACYSCCC
jgi:protein disulfide-isomerase A6